MRMVRRRTSQGWPCSMTKVSDVRKLPIKVAHYGRFDPRIKTGGVETFARNLGSVFEQIEFLTPDSPHLRATAEAGIPIICDNQMVRDLPSEIPVIGFQHGVAHEKAQLTKTRTDKKLARAQAAAAQRRNTLWVACAQWISRRFEELYGNAADHTIYHQVDVDRFDGKRPHPDACLLLHDGRSEHKGKKLFKVLRRTLSEWKFEALDCRPDDVPDRLRQGAAFLHLSRYEGNSIVCNEAMAMDMPCLFTRVGLMRDGQDLDVAVVEPEDVYGTPDKLVGTVSGFLESLETRTYSPRRWTLKHATPNAHRAAWHRVMKDFSSRFSVPLNLGTSSP